MTDRRTPPSTPPSRISRSLLQPWEAAALQKLVRRLPDGMTPDALTVIGLAGAALTGLSYALSNWNPAFLWLASAGLFVHWFGDSLDGALARHRQIERPNYGFFVDNSADQAAHLLIVVGLGLSPYVNLEVALLVTTVYLAVVCILLLKRAVSGTMEISFYAAGGTELRCILVAGNTAIYFIPPELFRTRMTFHTGAGTLTAIDFFLLAVAATALILLTFTVLRYRRNLARKEPPLR
jgi:phosphatidylglycerophosphate synthase